MRRLLVLVPIVAFAMLAAVFFGNLSRPPPKCSTVAAHWETGPGYHASRT